MVVVVLVDNCPLLDRAEWDAMVDPAAGRIAGRRSEMRTPGNWLKAEIPVARPTVSFGADW